jgi:putative transposase
MQRPGIIRPQSLQEGTWILARFAEFEADWGQRHPAIIRLWRSSWEQFTPFLEFPPEIRKVIYNTNAVESLDARLRQATRRRGH